MSDTNWTITSLKEHMELALREQDRRIQQANEASQSAIHKAELAVDKRLDLLNEFRAQAADEAKKYVGIMQWDALREKVTALESAKDKLTGAILLLALIGIANLIMFFMGGKS